MFAPTLDSKAFFGVDQLALIFRLSTRESCFANVGRTKR
jgi:hypothetical protein